MRRKIALVSAVLGVFLLIGLSAQAKTLDSDLAQLHFGSQDPTNSSMPNNLELARPWLFNWNQIEATEGTFDWTTVDKEYKAIQKEGYTTLGVIIPFAKWDQQTCRNDACLTQYDEADKVGLEYVCNPCQEDKYRRFVKKLTERYDGDGKKDMLGLKIPIKAWEVWNEPDLVDFYIGDSADYAHLLKITHNAIMKKDATAMVLNGGISNISTDTLDFWQNVFKQSKKYTDAISLHCVGCGENNTLNIKTFNEFAADNHIEQKPVWLTELQLNNMVDSKAAVLMTEALAYAYAHNTDKVFFVEFEYNLEKYTKTKQALKLLIKKLKKFTAVRVNTEFFNPAADNVDVGVYEFTKGDSTVLVAWGGGNLSLGGTVTSAVDIFGNNIAVTNNTVELSKTPYIIKIN